MKIINFNMKGMTAIWAELGGLFYAFNAIALILSAGCLFGKYYEDESSQTEMNHKQTLAQKEKELLETVTAQRIYQLHDRHHKNTQSIEQLKDLVKVQQV